MALEQAQPIKLCKCGCGKDVKKVTQHYYLRHKPKVLLDKCGCGCGEKPKPGKRFKKGHNGREKFLPLEEAMEIIKSLDIKSQEKYYTLAKEGKLPKDLPHSPDIFYKAKGWNNWYDYLGKDKPVEPLSFEEARNVIHKFELKSVSEFRKLKRHKGTLPEGIPARPDTEYKNKGWTNWPDFVGYKLIEQNGNFNCHSKRLND
jgi:hypothetical protein